MEKLNSGYKAKEWQGYLYGLAPALLHGILPAVYWEHFCKLVHAIRILHQRSITQAQIREAQELLQRFHVDFERLYVQRRTDRIHFVRPCMHALLHLALEVPRLGPPALYAAWTMEWTIGNLGEEISQPSNPYKNLSERAVKRVQVNALMSMVPTLDTSTLEDPQGSFDLGDGFILMRPLEKRPERYNGRIGELIGIYVQDASAAIGKEVRLASIFALARWGQLRLPTGQIVRTGWKENPKPIDEVRRSRCVKVSNVEALLGCHVNGSLIDTAQQPNRICPS